MSLTKAVFMTCFWITMSMLCATAIGYYYGTDAALTYLTGYTVEKLLSFDNLLMFYIIFTFLRITPVDQAKCLNWGIIGAIAMRGVIIFSGAITISHFPWILYGLGLFLVYSGLCLGFLTEDAPEPPNALITWLRNMLPNAGILLITIIVIEITDVMFAMDSLPAIFGITTNPLIIATSNLFAILGLRSLYFVMLALLDKLHYLPTAVAVILVFIGSKMLIVDFIQISTTDTFIFVIMALLIAITASLLREQAK